MQRLRTRGDIRLKKRATWWVRIDHLVACLYSHGQLSDAHCIVSVETISLAVQHYLYAWEG